MEASATSEPKNVKSYFTWDVNQKKIYMNITVLCEKGEEQYTDLLH